jgi:molybdenum cofactor guanylyltransferase
VTAAPSVAGLVLAGGRSSRFGRDKLAEPLDGRPLLDHAIDAIRSVAGDVIVVVAPDSDRPAPPDVRIVRDEHAFDGPLAGLAAGLAATDADVVVVVAGDMPSVRSEVLAHLVDSLATAGTDASVLAVGDDRPPLPMALRREPAAAAARDLLATGERRLRALPEALRAAVVPEALWRRDDPEGASLIDVDEPADLP